MWTMLFTMLSTAAVPLIWMVLRAVGVGLVAYGGLTLLVSYIGDKIEESFSGMPYAMYQMMSLMGIPTAVNILLSSLVGIMVLKGLMNADGRMKRKTVWGAPPGGLGGGA